MIGAVLVRLGLSGAHTSYVKPSMGRWIVLAGAVLLAMAVIELLLADSRSGAAPSEAADGHGHEADGAHGGHRVGWLLLLPVLVLFVVAPGSLGRFGVQRVGSTSVVRGGPSFARLDPAAGTVSMSAVEFVQRTIDARGQSFNGATVRVTGFLVPGVDADGAFVIARYTIACCAADALVAKVRVLGVAAPVLSEKDDETWIAVEGTYEAAEPATNEPTLRATAVERVAVPDNPYG